MATTTALSVIHAVLSKGSTDKAAVIRLQKQLHILGYIAKGGIDGIFGLKTENAVKDVQRQYNKVNIANIRIDGKVGIVTGYAIEKAVANTPQLNSEGKLVELASKYLVWAGLLTTEKAKIDTVMQRAIISFQSKNGLYQTGTLNTPTILKLVDRRKSQVSIAIARTTIKEMANGEFNHETKPVFLTTGLIIGSTIWLIWWLNHKKAISMKALA